MADVRDERYGRDPLLQEGIVVGTCGPFAGGVDTGKVGIIDQPLIVEVIVEHLECGPGEPRRGADLSRAVHIGFECSGPVGHVGLQHQVHAVDQREVIDEVGGPAKSVLLPSETAEDERGGMGTAVQHAGALDHAGGTRSVVARSRDLRSGGIHMSADHDDASGASLFHADRHPCRRVDPLGHGDRHHVGGIASVPCEHRRGVRERPLFGGRAHGSRADLPRDDPQGRIGRIHREGDGLPETERGSENKEEEQGDPQQAWSAGEDAVRERRFRVSTGSQPLPTCG